ncbi:hypothetical protein, conserved [Plasmodium gonderi]|uniref:DNA/RNA-binding protein Alba-like domain-containing protein n=1 Tax=Plasmodium gonderi TaxID=77519 RepID=A0A1Y1JQM9_PLAGO|nr:hypothetical protein, conserved [Plasmodium gonderi]GAW82763.1 hypothetical protein, conserved [Plasmodium gonderi]
MKQLDYYKIIVKTQSEDVQKYIPLCLERMKVGKVKIVGRQHGIIKALTLLELLKKEGTKMNHNIQYENLKATGSDRRKNLEVSILLSLEN